MKTIHYTGLSHVRTLSAQDIESAFGIVTKDLVIDTRVSNEAVVSNALAKKLSESGEFVIVGEGTEEDEDREHDARVEAREAADRVQEEMDAERRSQMALQTQAKIESGEDAPPPNESAGPGTDSQPTKAAPSSRPSRTTTQ